MGYDLQRKPFSSSIGDLCKDIVLDLERKNRRPCRDPAKIDFMKIKDVFKRIHPEAPNLRLSELAKLVSFGKLISDARIRCFNIYSNLRFYGSGEEKHKLLKYRFRRIAK